MVKRGSSIGFFGIFGRSEDMRRLDEALRRAGLHPAQVPEGVKLAAVGLMAGEEMQEPPPTAYPSVGELMAFCALGADLFAHENGEARLAAATRRVEAALEAGEGRDAEIILLMLHAKLIHPALGDHYDIRAESED
ncbi:hypothetical protein [Chelativorans salis]|uniref:Uncharacterized protein n=1 Tax=Chelativorans salis TaxID=2978478 RepID=A0ABT2LPV2_9HYPH|nr:hypothetical protein [Chelativorans sp. EGI FJ00035]MCT7376586.1 hypothetical protein [Chelativorans sp. EGI FJ00035]